VTDPSETPWRTELSGDVRCVGRKHIIDTDQVVLSINALVALDIGDLGRCPNGVQGLERKLAGYRGQGLGYNDLRHGPGGSRRGAVWASSVNRSLEDG
jgi:hypothetical protein